MSEDRNKDRDVLLARVDRACIQPGVTRAMGGGVRLPSLKAVVSRDDLRALRDRLFAAEANATADDYRYRRVCHALDIAPAGEEVVAAHARAIIEERDALRAQVERAFIHCRTAGLTATYPTIDDAVAQLAQVVLSLRNEDAAKKDKPAPTPAGG